MSKYLSEISYVILEVEHTGEQRDIHDLLITRLNFTHRGGSD